MLGRTSYTLMLALAAAAACSEPAPARAPEPRTVVVTRVERRDVDVEVRCPVELRAAYEVELSAKAIGYLSEVLVDEGDHIRRGQHLAIVKPSELRDRQSVARANLAQAQASSTYAWQNYRRSEALVKIGAISVQDHQLAQSELSRAGASSASAAAELASTATKLEETVIVAPFDGVVTRRRLDPGALVGSVNAGPILTVAQIDFLRAVITVPERESPLLKVGQPGKVELDAVAKVLPGEVSRVSPTLHPQTRSRQAELRITNASALMPGMFGRGSVVVERHPSALVVPSNAVRVSDGRRWCFVLVGDRVARREVKTGVDGGTWLEVTEGLTASDEVVVAGSDGIADGAPVKAMRGIDPYTGAPPPTADAGAPSHYPKAP